VFGLIKRLDKGGYMAIIGGIIEFKLRLGQEQVLTPGINLAIIKYKIHINQ
jgi:hypothetical protein